MIEGKEAWFWPDLHPALGPGGSYHEKGYTKLHQAPYFSKVIWVIQGMSFLHFSPPDVYDEGKRRELIFSIEAPLLLREATCRSSRLRA